MQEVRPRTPRDSRRRGSSSLQRGCLRAVPAPREIPWLCVPPSPAVCPLERSYTVGGGKNYALCEDMHERRYLERASVSHYALFIAKRDTKRSGGEVPAARRVVCYAPVYLQAGAPSLI